MLRLTRRIACFSVLLFVATSVVAQTEFSADIVNHGKDKNQMTRLYLGKNKIRFDSPDKNGGAIMDLQTGDFLVIMPQQHMYMAMSADRMEDRGTFRFLVYGDVENACAEWLQQANKGGTCKKDGEETVNGRSTVKYEGVNAKGESTSVWLDPKLRFPIKWEGKNGGGGELQNIQEGAQPASLFEVPSGFVKMDVNAMMQQRNK